jgi:hypothetical protein
MVHASQQQPLRCALLQAQRLRAVAMTPATQARSEAARKIRTALELAALELAALELAARAALAQQEREEPEARVRVQGSPARVTLE